MEDQALSWQVEKLSGQQDYNTEISQAEKKLIVLSWMAALLAPGQMVTLVQMVKAHLTWKPIRYRQPILISEAVLLMVLVRMCFLHRIRLMRPSVNNTHYLPNFSYLSLIPWTFRPQYVMKSFQEA